MDPRLALAAALALAPLGARAQLRPEPMRLRAAPDAQVVAGRFGASAAGDDLLVAQGVPRTAALRPARDLLATVPCATPFPGGVALRGGRLAQNGADALTDVAFPGGGGVVVAFGDAPATLRSFATSRAPAVIGFAHLLPREGDVLVMQDAGSGTGTGRLMALDFDAAPVPAATERSWPANGVSYTMVASDQQVFPIRLSPVARQLGIDDLAVVTSGGLYLYWHRAAPTGATLADLDLGAAPTVIGGSVPAGTRPPWLPATVEWKGDPLGVGLLDVDGDGVLDLVMAYANALPATDATGAALSGHLVAIPGTGDPAALATSPWQDLTLHPDLQPLPDPVRLRGFDLAGEPALAVWDRTLHEVLVVTAAGGGRLRVWRAPASGDVADLVVADVVGSSAPDLVVSGEELLVYPDLGDASPALAWAPGSPGAPVRGEDHPMAVLASDPDDALLEIEWLVGDPAGAAVASGPAWVLAGSALCAASPQTVEVTVRATDPLGVFVERSATLSVALAPPALSLAGGPGAALVLAPGGADAQVEGSIWSACGRPVTFTWGGTALPPEATVGTEQGPTWTRQALHLPEAAYPALLGGGTPELTLAAVDDTGLASPVARLEVPLDGSGLVLLRHGADRAAIAPGELAVLRTRIASRLGVALPRVELRDLLAGLEPAGPPRVAGAAVAEVREGGAVVVLAELPAGAEVLVELPVRGVRAGATSAVEARSSGGHRLTPPAAAGRAGPVVPGCGCGEGGAGAGGLALAVVALWRRRRAVT